MWRPGETLRGAARSFSKVFGRPRVGRAWPLVNKPFNSEEDSTHGLKTDVVATTRDVETGSWKAQQRVETFRELEQCVSQSVDGC